jgi:hypothetical protein
MHFTSQFDTDSIGGTIVPAAIVLNPNLRLPHPSALLTLCAWLSLTPLGECQRSAVLPAAEDSIRISMQVQPNFDLGILLHDRLPHKVLFLFTCYRKKLYVGPKIAGAKGDSISKALQLFHKLVLMVAGVNA